MPNIGHRDNPDEAWLPVPGFPGYEVSDLGRVYSLPRDVPITRNYSDGRPQEEFIRRFGGKMLTAYIDASGHLRVKLQRDSVGFSIEVHRLVALAFIGPRPDGQEVRHIHGRGAEPALSGLAYGTRQENIDDQMRHGVFAIGERHGTAKLTEAQVIEILSGTETARSLAARLNVKIGTIYGIRGRWKWRFIDGISQPNRRSVGKVGPVHYTPSNTPCGPAHHNARLTCAQVSDIRRDGRGNRTLAPIYGVSHKTISLVKRRLVYASCPD